MPRSKSSHSHNEMSRSRIERTLRASIGIVLLFGLWACAAATFEPIPNWSLPLCASKAVPVRTPWDLTVSELFDRLHKVVISVQITHPRRQGWRAPSHIVVVTGGSPPGHVAGWLCFPTIVYHIIGIQEAYGSDQPEAALARVIAHEFAHAALRHDLSVVDHYQGESEADALGAYYFEKAGFDCDWWVQKARRRMLAQRGEGFLRDQVETEREYAAVKQGCALSKEGRVPLSPRFLLSD